MLNCGILNPVSERNNNEINKMNNENIETIRAEFKDQFMSDNNTVLVSCCGCGEELHISHEEASQWTDTDLFQCHECE
mgnify:FL=1